MVPLLVLLALIPAFGLAYWAVSVPWARPLVYVTLTPIVTVPVTATLLNGIPKESLGFVGGSNWETYRVSLPWMLVTLLPGAFNLVPFLWLTAEDTSVRTAALIAGLVGALRFVAPVIVMLAQGSTIEYTYSTLPELPTIGISVALWGLTFAGTVLAALLHFGFASPTPRRTV